MSRHVIALLEDGSYRPSEFLNVIGPSYIPIAFKAAREADPDAKLYYNDFEIDRVNNKTEAVRKLVEFVRANNAPIDGIGRQAHLGAKGPTQQEQEAVHESWADLNLDIAITELDVGLVLPLNEKRVQGQIRVFRDTAAACVNTKRCVGIVLWGYSDRVRLFLTSKMFTAFIFSDSDCPC